MADRIHPEDVVLLNCRRGQVDRAPARDPHDPTAPPLWRTDDEEADATN
ncbi:hypothetical protein [Streptomyces lydicus]